jgi:hypothetical protein
VAQLLNERLQPIRQRRIPIRHRSRSNKRAKHSPTKLTNPLRKADLSAVDAKFEEVCAKAFNERCRNRRNHEP